MLSNPQTASKGSFSQFSYLKNFSDPLLTWNRYLLRGPSYFKNGSSVLMGDYLIALFPENIFAIDLRDISVQDMGFSHRFKENLYSLMKYNEDQILIFHPGDSDCFSILTIQSFDRNPHFF